MQNNPSQALDPIQRRCAAFMTLTEVLEGESLMNALWMLEERDQTANKVTFIGFFGVTAELMGINSNLISSLYSKLNRNLNLPSHELPEDPMPEMLKYRGVKSDDQQVKTEEKTETHQIDSKPKPATKTKVTAEMIIGATLITNIALEAGYPGTDSYALFNEVFKEEISSDELENDIKEQLLSWIDTLSIKAFKRNYSAKQLSFIVHCVYIALCEALGPVKADLIMSQAINKTSKLPAAKEYSPKKFL